MSLYVGKELKLFVKVDDHYFEIPTLDGASFSQSANTAEVGLNQAALNQYGGTFRGRKMHTTSLAPVEFSFQTYMRPFITAGHNSGTLGGALGGAGEASKHTTVEAVLWALFTGKTNAVSATGASAFTSSIGTSASGATTILANGGSNQVVGFGNSNFVTLGEAEFIFVLYDNSASGAAGINYHIKGGVLTEATIDFDIEGLATISWSGQGTRLVEGDNQAALGAGGTDVDTLRRSTANVVFEGRDAHNTFIHNKLTTMTLTPNTIANGTNFRTLLTGGGSDNYVTPITGGSLTFSNNITFLTPEELGIINVPMGHVAGMRTISGTMTAYLDEVSGGTADLFQDLSEDGLIHDVNSFEIEAAIGGGSAPNCTFNAPTCHVSVPTHSVDDLISVEVAFDCLPSQGGKTTTYTPEGTNEATLTYVGVTNDNQSGTGLGG